MLIYITASLSGIITMMLLDYLWLAKLAKSFYLEKLSSHIIVTNGSLVPYLPAVPIVYIIAILSIWVFVLSSATSLTQAALYGALLGFFMYAFYDFTNLATLKDYPWSLTIVDIIWGTILIGTTTAVMFYVKSLFS
jgi:uncharacterized membrane protein